MCSYGAGDFWEETRLQLEQVKPVFMLAESDQPELNRKAFDMTYGCHFITDERDWCR